MDKPIKSYNSFQELIFNVKQKGSNPTPDKSAESDKKVQSNGKPSSDYMKAISEKLSVFNKIDKELSNSKSQVLNEASIHETIDNEGRYKDKEETFECNVSVEGTSLNTAKARLLFVTESWNLFFEGTIANGKCTIPLKKMEIFEEGTTGEAILEIIIDDELFVPWREKFIVEKQKKIEIAINAIKSVTIS